MPDSDGYPFEDELAYIESFDVVKNHWENLMEYVQDVWHWGSDYFYKDGEFWYAHTGGWSGNEEIIGSLMQNTMFWILCWQESKKGGHYKFRHVVKENNREY